MALFDYLVNLIQAGNVKISGNTISSENVNGSIAIMPNGTGSVGINKSSPESGGSFNIRLHSNGSMLIGNENYLIGETTSGLNIRIAGVTASNDVYLGAIDNAGGKLIFREDGSNVALFDGGKLTVGGSAPAARLHVLEASTAPVAIFETETTGANPKRVLYQFRGQTTAIAYTDVEIGSITVPAYAAGNIQYSIIGTRNITNDYAHVIKARGFKSSATVVSGAGSVGTVIDQSDNAYTAAEYMNGSDLVIRFRVTGDSIDTMVWHAHVTMDIVS